MSKKKKKPVEPLKVKDKGLSIRVEVSVKKQMGRIPVPKCGYFHKPKKGKGSYDRKKESNSWRKERW